MTSAFPVETNHFYVPIDDESALTFVRGSLSEAARQSFVALQRTASAEINRPALSYGYSTIKGSGRHLVLAVLPDDDALVGYAACMPLEHFGQVHGLVTEVIVSPEYRGRGVGLALLEAVENVLRSPSKMSVSGFGPGRLLATIVPAANQRGLDFCLKAGYSVVCKGDLYLLHRAIPIQ